MMILPGGISRIATFTPAALAPAMPVEAIRIPAPLPVPSPDSPGGCRVSFLGNGPLVSWIVDPIRRFPPFRGIRSEACDAQASADPRRFPSPRRRRSGGTQEGRTLSRPASNFRHPAGFRKRLGQACVLRFVKGVWHIRDLGSTNGTSVNGQQIAHETGIMPGDDVGVANHFFTIDYDPIAPTSLMDANQFLEEEIGETKQHKSLMELAGLSQDDGRSRPPSAQQLSREDLNAHRPPQPPFEDVVADRSVKSDHRERDEAPAGNDDDFFDLIRGDIDPDRTGEAEGLRGPAPPRTDNSELPGWRRFRAGSFSRISPMSLPAIPAADRAVGSDQERGGDRADVEGRQKVAAAGHVMDLRPGDLAASSGSRLAVRGSRRD